jgi:hypothetical protein
MGQTKHQVQCLVAAFNQVAHMKDQAITKPDPTTANQRMVYLMGLSGQ